MRRFDDDDKPKFSFRPRWRHLLYLVDAVIIVAFFFIGGWAFRTTVGDKKIAEGERLRLLAQANGSRLLEQADSVVTVERARLATALADSATWAEDFLRRRVALEAAVTERQQLTQTLYPMTDQIFDFRDRSTKALADLAQLEKEIKTRKAEVVDLRSQSDQAGNQLDEEKRLHEDSMRQLARARSTRTYEPVGMFPDKSGLLVRQDISSCQELTNVQLQHSFWTTPGKMDLGLSLGLGLGSQDVASAKEFGLVVTRPLIHRRLGLDLGAGYSVLTSPDGQDDQGAYASAGLRFFPWYRERFHLGLGARAGQEEVRPFVSVGVGRR